MRTFLDFEKPIAELEDKIAELRHLSSTSELNIADEIRRLQGKLDALLKQIYGKLTPWQKAQVARHIDRPHTLDYIGRWPAIVPSPTIRRWWAGSAGWPAAPACCWARRKARTPKRGSSTTSACRARRAIARHSG